MVLSRHSCLLQLLQCQQLKIQLSTHCSSSCSSNRSSSTRRWPSGARRHLHLFLLHMQLRGRQQQARGMALC